MMDIAIGLGCDAIHHMSRWIISMFSSFLMVDASLKLADRLIPVPQIKKAPYGCLLIIAAEN
jgi:hypothetical protein